MNDDIDKIIAEVERLDREATPGPWHDRDSETENGYSTSAISPDSADEDGLSPADLHLVGRTIADGLSGHNAAFIAISRTAAPLLAAEVRRLRAELAFADQRGAEAIDRVSTAIVNDKWNATAAFQDRAIKAEMENARLNVLLTASVNETARMQTERNELRAEVQQRIAHGNALYDAIVRCLAPHYPAGSRDLDWDVLPGTLAALARERDELRLTIAAEQGRQEGAPSEGWQAPTRIRTSWRKEGCGWLIDVAKRYDVWDWDYWLLGVAAGAPSATGTAPTARAAMLAADAATG